MQPRSVVWSHKVSTQNFIKSPLTHKRFIRVNTICSVDAVAKDSFSDAQTLQKELGFSWENQWYPIAPEHDLDKDIPHPLQVAIISSHTFYLDEREFYLQILFQILGRRLVLWFDPKESVWSCFLDSCPHRFVPLSKGRIDKNSGCLECSYHAWKFKANGSCFSIPQLENEEQEKAKSK